MTERTVAGLRCSEVLARLSDYIDGELDAAEVKDVEKHLLGCPNCERFGKNFGSMVVSLRSAPKPAHPVDSELVTRLLAQLDELSPED
jgi:anti-sigma factor RsiW